MVGLGALHYEFPRLGLFLVRFALLLFVPAALSASQRPGDRAELRDSIVAVPAGGLGSQPRVVRGSLTAAESAAQMDFVVSLRMRNFERLESMIQAGLTVSRTEMESDYLPNRTDYARVASWLKGRGFTLTLSDNSHTNIFARGSVALVSDAFGVTFARVATAEGEFTSAITAPGVPVELAGAVLSINGLQPHIRARHRPIIQGGAGGLGTIDGSPTPADIANAYNVPSNLTGAGQTIAVICDAVPANSDLTAFWSACGIAQSLANYTVIDVAGGPGSGGDVFESTLDVEWASSMAPGAAIRFYAIPDLQYSSIQGAAAQILNDQQQNPGLNQVSISICGPENEAGGSGTLTSYSQTYALLAAAGVSVFACSGDGGSNPNPDAATLGYSPSYALTVEYPASDPNLTAVGGTEINFNSDWTPAGETTWFEVNPLGSTATVASGGGVSTRFPRPAWQVGIGVPAGTFRCVPDVAAQAKSGYLRYKGQDYTAYGTSLATPIWAGLTALINQARSEAGQAGMGILGSQVYPLIGTGDLTDITTGDNGAYSAGVGYDLCTGVGTPNVANLVAALAAKANPVIGTQPASQTVNSGSDVVFNVTASGAANFTYQWKLNGANLTDGGAVSGSNGPQLLIQGSSAANNGVYECVVTAGGVSLTSKPALLSVTVSPVPGYVVNISSRAFVGTGDSILIGGFFVGGSTSRSVLIQALGPALSSQGVSGVLQHPALSIHDSTGAVIYSNTGWGSSPVLLKAAAAAYANPVLQPDSADSEALLTLPPGGYTAEISGADGGTGVALCAIYQLP
jgi:kumamolisin